MFVILFMYIYILNSIGTRVFLEHLVYMLNLKAMRAVAVDLDLQLLLRTRCMPRLEVLKGLLPGAP